MTNWTIFSINTYLSQYEVVLGLIIYWIIAMAILIICRLIWNYLLKSNKFSAYSINIIFTLILLTTLLITFAWLTYGFSTINTYIIIAVTVLSGVLSYMINHFSNVVSNIIFPNSFMEKRIALVGESHLTIPISRFVLVFNQLSFIFVFLINVFLLFFSN